MKNATQTIKQNSIVLFLSVALILTSGGGTAFFLHDLFQTPVAHAAGWYDGAWQYRQQITIDHTKIDANLSDFPVYVDLGDLDSTFFNTVKSDGGDIRVTLANGTTEVPREVVSINVASSTGALHFKAPTLSSTADTSFYIYYNNPNATEPAASSAYGSETVWSDYEIVSHLSDDPTGTITDSTGNGNTASTTGSMTVTDVIDAPTGNGLLFDGTDDAVNYGNAGNMRLFDMTASIHFKWQDDGAIIAKSFYSGEDSRYFALLRQGANQGSVGFDVGNNYNTSFTADSYLDGAWHVMHIIYDRDSAASVYIDGNFLGQTDISAGENYDLNKTNELILGRYNDENGVGYKDGAGLDYQGGLAEFRNQRRTLSSAWIDAEVANQNSPSTFYTAGEHEVHNNDFKVQRGTTVLTGTSTVVNAGTDYEILQSGNAFVRITNAHYTGAGSGTGSVQPADDVTAYIGAQDAITDSFTITRPQTASGTTRVDWEIVEFVGLSGSDNEMVVRDTGALTYGGSATNTSGAVVADVADDSDVVVFITGLLNPSTGTTSYSVGQSVSAWDSGAQKPVFTRASAGGVSAGVSYAVVEFTGQNWSVQRVAHAYTATSTTETEPITAVNSLTRTFLHTQKMVGAGLGGVDEFGHEVWLSSIGNVSFRLEVGASNPNSHTSVAWVVENTQTGIGAMEVTRSSGLTQGGVAPLIASIPIGKTLRDTDEASLFVNTRGSGTGTEFPDPILGATVVSTTHYALWRSRTAATVHYRAVVVEWPAAIPAVTQNDFRFYTDNGALTPIDPWPTGGTDLGENTSITVADMPLGYGDRVRIRMSLAVSDATLPAQSRRFKLQYAVRNDTCGASDSWQDVGAVGSTAAWRGYNATSVSDGVVLSSDPPAGGDLLLTVSDVSGTYEEENVSAYLPYDVPAGSDVEYDWIVEHNNALSDTDYCFRMVKMNGKTLDQYAAYPTIHTEPFVPTLGSWKWFDDDGSLTPTSSLAATNTAPIDIANQNVLKLRTSVHETNGASERGVKFALQYSQYSDFHEANTVISQASCQDNSVWCYADGAGTDNATITESVLSDTDACSGGIGAGCGTHNETASTSSDFTHGAFNNTEYEFTIRHAGARVNTVYYFRLYDTVNDTPVQASTSNPSVVTEGASMIFQMSGVASSTTLEGVTTDVHTTPSTISFGTLPINSQLEAAHRIVVDTNGTEGYQLLMYGNSDLQNAYGESIAPVSGNNISPTSWTIGCPQSAAGCFGYHSGDDLLEGGSTRFAANDTYAGLSSTTPVEIGYNSAPASAEVTDIIYRIQVRELQSAGEYETGITYIAIPVF